MCSPWTAHVVIDQFIAKLRRRINSARNTTTPSPRVAEAGGTYQINKQNIQQEIENVAGMPLEDMINNWLNVPQQLKEWFQQRSVISRRLKGFAQSQKCWTLKMEGENL